MNRKLILTPKTIKHIKEINRTDILVGVPSYNNEDTIGHVVNAVRVGLTKFFPELKSVIVNSDCGSSDSTRKVVRKNMNDYRAFDTILITHDMHPYIRSLHIPVQEMVTTFRGAPGKGKAFRRIFEIAYELEAKAVVVVDSDLRSITPEWIQLLAGPILLKNFDYVSPLYARHKYDGTITNSLIYPITRSLYGRKIRQPIGGEFGFSHKVLNHFVKEDIWDTDVAYYGIDIWMTTVALANGFKICQSFLGAKIHNPKSVSTLAPMFKQVIGTIFSLIEENHKRWQKIRESTDLPTFGFQARTIPEEVPMEFNEPFQSFHSGYEKFSCFWKEILGKENHRDIEKIVSLTARSFNFPYAVWVKIIYNYILYLHRFKNASIEMSISLVLESLIPLYFGFTASFVKKTKKMNNQEAEKEIENLCLNFEKFKPYLVDNWNKRN
jgi:glycosyltransferase involved in cell wall biosynthesis